MFKLEEDVVYILIALGLLSLILALVAMDRSIAEAWLEQGYTRSLSVSHSSVRHELESIGCDMARPAMFAQDIATGETVVLIGDPSDYQVCTAPTFGILQSMELEKQLQDDDDAAMTAAAAMGAGSR